MRQLSRKQKYFRQHYFWIILCCFFIILTIIQTTRIGSLKREIQMQSIKLSQPSATPHTIYLTSPTPQPTSTPIAIAMATATPKPSLDDDPENEYTGEKLNAVVGTVNGPSGKETYYNLPMDYVVEIMRDLGYSVEDYPYWVREDGCKMFGPYIMCAADLSIRPKGTILKSSLGDCMVVDTGEFIYSNQRQIDIAVNW